MSEYFGRLTEVGIAAEAWAKTHDAKVRLTHIAVGDGGGEVPVPSGSETELVHENYRSAIESYAVDETDENVAYLTIVIPADQGGWWIREAGVFAEDPAAPGTYLLYAYFNHAPTYKQLAEAGQATTHELRIPVIYSSDSALTLQIRENGYALRTELLDLKARVESLHAITRATWTLSVAVGENGTVTLPPSLAYEVGSKSLRLYYLGLLLAPDEQYEEVGSSGESSHSVKLLFAADKGDEFQLIIKK